MILRSVGISLALGAAGLAEAAPDPRTPAGKWVVDFADAQCVAQRDYGAAGSPRLVLKAPPIGEVMQVAILRDATWTFPEQADATVVVGERGPVKTSLVMFSPKGSKQRIYLLNMPFTEFDAVRGAKTFSVRSGSLNEAFTLAGMDPLMKVMDRCVADLRRVFNIAAEGSKPAGLKTRAKANLAKYFSSGDYPNVALQKGQTGRVRFALLIQEDGRVADCTIVATSGVPSLDTQACATLKARARFEPARAHDGKPAKDAVVGAVAWRL